MKKIILMLVLALAAAAQAELIKYDSFNEAPTARAAGWAPAGWTSIDPLIGAANVYIKAGSLTVPGLKVSEGNSLGLLNKTGDYYLDFNTVTLGVGDTIYFSFIEKYNVLPGATATGAGGTIRLINSVDGVAVAKGITIYRAQPVPPTANNADFGLAPNNAGIIKTPSTNGMLETYFIVGSYTRGATDTSGALKLWINPDSATFGTANPPVPTLSMASVLSADTFDRLYIYSGGSQSWTTDWQFDELRIGTGWASVAPSEFSAPDPDSDNDGIPDEWEIQHFGGSTNANPNAMAANGVNTVLEAYVAGLNPTNSEKFLSSVLRPPASASILQWNAASGRVYSVYWITNLLGGFQPLETNLVWPRNSWTDTVHGAQGEGFYRIKVQMQP